LRPNGKPSRNLLEFSSDQISNGPAEFGEGCIPLLSAPDVIWLSATERETIAADGFDRFIGVSDFEAPTAATSKVRQAWITVLPAPDVQLIERFAESLPLLGGRLYLLVLGFWFAGGRFLLRPVSIGEQAFFNCTLQLWL
jgi:hypothetical protein